MTQSGSGQTATASLLYANLRTGRLVELPLDPEHEVYIVGRAPACDLRVQGPQVDRRHVFLRWSGHGWVLLGDASTCGTFLDGRHNLDDIVLRHGQQIRLGTDPLQTLVFVQQAAAESLAELNERPLLSGRELVAHGLPPLELELDARGSSMMVQKFPAQGELVSLSSPPGGALVFTVGLADPAGGSVGVSHLAALVAARHSGSELLLFGQIGLVPVDGTPCPALGYLTGTSHARAVWGALLLRVEGGPALLARYGYGPASHVCPSPHLPLLHPVLRQLLFGLRVRSAEIAGTTQP